MKKNILFERKEDGFHFLKKCKGQFSFFCFVLIIILKNRIKPERSTLPFFHLSKEEHSQQRMPRQRFDNSPVATSLKCGQKSLERHMLRRRAKTHIVVRCLCLCCSYRFSHCGRNHRSRSCCCNIHCTRRNTDGNNFVLRCDFCGLLRVFGSDLVSMKLIIFFFFFFFLFLFCWFFNEISFIVDHPVVVVVVVVVIQDCIR